MSPGLPFFFESIRREHPCLRIKNIQKQIENNLCSSIPNAFWNRKQHMVSLPYEKDFNEKQIHHGVVQLFMSKKLLR